MLPLPRSISEVSIVVLLQLASRNKAHSPQSTSTKLTAAFAAPHCFIAVLLSTVDMFVWRHLAGAPIFLRSKIYLLRQFLQPETMLLVAMRLSAARRVTQSEKSP